MSEEIIRGTGSFPAWEPKPLYLLIRVRDPNMLVSMKRESTSHTGLRQEQ